MDNAWSMCSYSAMQRASVLHLLNSTCLTLPHWTGSNWSSHCLYSFAFSAMPYSEDLFPVKCKEVVKEILLQRSTCIYILHEMLLLFISLKIFTASANDFFIFLTEGKAAHLISYQINSWPYLYQNITYTLKFFCNGPNPIKTKNISAMYFQESSFKTL